MAWVNLPQWKDEERAKYLKFLESNIRRLQGKQYRSASEQKRLDSYIGKKKEIENRA